MYIRFYPTNSQFGFNSSNCNEKGNCSWDPFFPQAPLIEKIVDPPLKLSLHTNKPPSPLCWSDSQWYFLERNLRELSALLVVLSLPVRCFLPVTVLTQIIIKSSFLGSHISISGNCKSVFFLQVHMHKIALNPRATVPDKLMHTLSAA